MLATCGIFFNSASHYFLQAAKPETEPIVGDTIADCGVAVCGRIDITRREEIVRKFVAAVLMVPMLTSGCATLFMGTTDHMTVLTDPTGAQVTVNGEPKGLSPTSFTVPSDQTLNVHVAKEGYQPQDIENNPTSRSGYELLSLAAGLIPLVVDRADGAALGHETTTMNVHLVPQPIASLKADAAILRASDPH